MRQQPLCDPPMSHLTHLRDSSLRSVLLVKKQAQRTWIGPTQACIAPELGFSPPRCWLWLSLGYFGWVNEPRPSGHFHNPASQTGRLEEKKQTVWESLRKILIHVHELSSVDICRESESRSVVSNSDSIDYTVHGILQARILEWVAFPSPGDLPNPGIEPRCPALKADSLPAEPQGKPRHP